MVKKIFNIICIFIIIILNIYSITYATTVQVTRENLTEAFQNIMDSNLKGRLGLSNIEVEEEKIKFMIDSEEFEISYDLTNEPTFIAEMNIQDGMTYDEYESEEAKMLETMLGYVAVASINNVYIDNAYMYILLSYMEEGIPAFGECEYAIDDDRNVGEGVEGNLTVEGKTVIKASEFGNYAMDYVNSMYANDPLVISDAKYVNTYEITMERQEITDTSCKVVITLKINTDADFSGITQLKEEKPEEEQGGGQGNIQSTTNITNEKDKTTANAIVPKVGINKVLGIALGVLVVALIIFRIKYKISKDIK